MTCQPPRPNQSPTSFSSPAAATWLHLVLVWASEDEETGTEKGYCNAAANDKDALFERPAAINAYDTQGFIADLVQDTELFGKAGSST